MNGAKPNRRKFSPRGLVEALATIMIIAGIVMLMQPLWLVLFTYSFVVILAGTVLFMAGSKLPE